MATVAGASAIIGFLTRPVTAAAAVIAGRQAVLAAIRRYNRRDGNFLSTPIRHNSHNRSRPFQHRCPDVQKTTRKTNPVPRRDAMSYKAYLTE